MKLNRTERLLHFLQLAHSWRHFTVRQLSDELCVTRRTLFRDLAVLRKVGLRCEFDTETDSYHIDPASHLRPLALSRAEALALLLVTRKFVDPRMTPLVRAATSAGLKVEAALPRDVVEHCGRLLAGVHVGGWCISDISIACDLLLQILEAVADRHKLRINYDSYRVGCQMRAVVRPYAVTFRGRGWYLVGYSETQCEIRTFKIERIVELELLTQGFRYPRGFNVDDYFRNLWHMVGGDVIYHVELVFSAKVAGGVEEVAWHATQRTRRRSDGTLVFEVDVAGLDEIAFWALGYGDQVVVNRPDQLRRMIASQAANVLRYYGPYGAHSPVSLPKISSGFKTTWAHHRRPGVGE